MDLCVAMHADQDQMLQIRENYCCACSLIIFKNYGFACIVVVICLFITVFSSVQGTLFMQTLIDDYIIPLTKQASPDFTELAHAIGRVAIFYACGVLASFAQSKIMVYVTQGTLRNLRNDMFIHMEGLRSVTLTLTHMVILCQPIRTILIPCAR